MRPELLVPLDCLPGPVPSGAPCGHYFLLPPPEFPLTCDGPMPKMVLVEGLDLSAPPVDAKGWPTRIDGADVAAGMLARAMGLDTRGGVVCRVPFVGLRLESGGRAVVFWPESDLPACGIPGLTLVSAPALSTIDPTDPDAARLALAAVLRARVWEVERG